MKNMLSKKRPMQKVIHIITITKPLGIYENAERPCKTLGSVVFLKKLPQILLISLFSKTTLNEYILSKGKHASPNHFHLGKFGIIIFVLKRNSELGSFHHLN